MRNKKTLRLMAGLLSAAMLFTSENMSCLAYAAPAEGDIYPPPHATITSESVESVTALEEPTPEDPSMGEEMPAGQEGSDPADNNDTPTDGQNSEENLDDNNGDSNEGNPGEDEAGNPGDSNAGNTTETENPEEEPSPEEENPEEGTPGGEEETTLPDDSLLEDSVSSNSLMALEDDVPAVEVTDFDIVDEGGNVVSAKKDETEPTTVYILQEKATDANPKLGKRKFSVKAAPEGAVAEEITWTVDNKKISVTDGITGGEVSLKSDALLTTSETATVTAQIGEISKTCKVMFLPKMTGFDIVDESGTVITDKEITITPGQQKKLGVKITPEGAVSISNLSWTVPTNRYLRIDKNGIVTVTMTPSDSPAGIKVTVKGDIINPATGQKERLEKSCTVTIVARETGIQCGDILVSSPGLGTYKQSTEAANTWEADIDNNSGLSFFYTGEEAEGSTYKIYYANSGRDIQINNDRITYAMPYREDSQVRLKPKLPLQLVLETTNSDRTKTYSDIYTIHFTGYRSPNFTITPTSIRTIPSGVAQEIKVNTLPYGAKTEDITWTSGDERLVKVTKTDDGARLTFGQGTGTTQVTAAVTDYKGQTRYAVCRVTLSMTLPDVAFSSESGGETSEDVYTEDDVLDTNYYWLIDKGGQVTLSVRSLPDAQIYYTTDGKNPKTSGIRYRSPITINAKTTIKAYAKMEGYEENEPDVMEFRIGNPKLTIPAAVSLEQGKSMDITKSVTLPTGADESELYWLTDDSDIADAFTEITYDENDFPTGSSHSIRAGSKSGQCTITASIMDYAGREQTASCKVTVKGALQITPAVTVEEGETADIKITKFPTGYDRSAVKWQVPDEDSSLITLESGADGAKLAANMLDDTTKSHVVTVTASLEKEGETLFSANCQVTVVPKQYTVRFYGWNSKLVKEEKVYRGQNATPPTDEYMNNAAPAGYAFDGWDESSSWENIQKDTEIHAKEYKPKSYTITYELGSKGTNPSDNPTSYDVKTAISLKDAAPTDATAHRFVGWYLDAECAGNPIDEIPQGSTGDITLYAKWASAATGLLIQPIADQAYTGTTVKPPVVVLDGDTPLTLGTDYTVSYKNNTNANDATDPKKAPTVTITGKGNYTKSSTVTFKILPHSIAADGTDQSDVVIPELYLAHTRKKLTPAPVVTWNGKKLKNGTDYAVTKIVKEGMTANVDCIDAGSYTVTVTGKGNFTGTRNIALTVTKKTLMSKVKVDKIADFTYSGTALGANKINPKLTCGKDTLTIGTDYTVSYDTNAINVGTYEVTFTGLGDYEGTVTKSFKITGIAIKASNLIIEGLETQKAYNGTEQSQEKLKIYYKKDAKTKELMTLGEHYTVTYENATNAGSKATVVITGINGYTGVVKKTFKITTYALDEKEIPEANKLVTVSLASPVPYEKGGAKPKPVVTYNGTELVEGTDYTISYKNNAKCAWETDPKAPEFTIKGKGNFSGSVKQNFSIEEQDVENLTLTAEDVMAAAPNEKKGEKVGRTAAGKYKSTPKLTDLNGKALAAGTDFLKTYVYTDENGVELGSKEQVYEGSILTVTVTGTKNYTGSASVSYRVLGAKKSVAGASVSLKKGVAVYYDSERITLKKDDLVVKIGKDELESKDYTIESYVNNGKKGTAKVTIRGVGKYGGRKTISFSIKAQEVKWRTGQ